MKDMTQVSWAADGRTLEFDLSSAPQISPRSGSIARFLSLAGLVGLLFLILLVVVLATLNGTLRFLPIADVAILGIVGLGIAFLGVIFFGLGPAAKSCLWNAQGFVLEYQNGRSRGFRWLDPELRIEISAVTYNGLTEYDLTTRMPFHNYVTWELLQAILGEANRRGLEVRPRVVESLGTSVCTYVIRSPPRVRLQGT